ncbi:hypothetical protein J2X46_004696 [Nocardioides sp. BE266]|uniref:hypothetical protein n=1 Tax=Nocardioides sp. BE266 TaxID=2817725 RepID=UPI00285624CA|nr:hypothetical protein [Nocardioides sp. BE266]MDR7255682.1 hypothetical protein [Nocardioides sp. BE266]
MTLTMMVGFAAAFGLVTATPAAASTTVTVDFTDIGIYPRSAPSMNSTKIGAALSDGTPVGVVCEVEAEVVSNGYEDIAIWDRLDDGTWLPNAFLNTGTASWTPGVPHCNDYDQGDDGSESVESGTSYDDPCMATWPGGTTTTDGVFGGSRTDYDAEMSRYLVCEGFGSDTSVEYSTGMKCAIIAATATVSGVPAAGNTASAACDVASFAEDGLGAVPGFACGLLGDFVATGSGVAAAGASAATGPGAVAVGVSTYRYLAATGEIVCGALFDDGAYDFGVQLESDHEARVAYDVVNLGMCLRQETRFGVLNWSAADC